MNKQNASSGNGPAVAQALTPGALDYLLEGTPKAEEFCRKLARVFQVGPDEVALYRLEKGFLKFLYPIELATVGLIPLSSSASVSAHTANSKKTELFNNFVKVKHTSVFEHIKLGANQEVHSDQLPIQKLMSAPILDEFGAILGVVQISHKGVDSSCGPNFALENLRQLELAAKVLARAAFMQQSDK